MPSTSYKVLVSAQIPDTGPSFLRKKGCIVDVLSPGQKLESQASHYDALITMLTDKIDSHFLKAHSKLKVISNFAVGTNNIDLSEATSLNILIGNTPLVLTEATAEAALGLMIATARNFSAAMENAASGEWKKWEPLGFLGHGLRGKTLGIIGSGRIGSRLAEMASLSFDMKIISVNSKAERFHLEALLRESDFISLHTPLRPDTRHLLSTAEFALMKKEAVVINTSRGEVIDQEALFEALFHKRIFGAGLDVTDPEPLPPTHKLYSLKNILILPHIASATFEARSAMSMQAAKNVWAGLNGHTDEGCFVNKKTSILEGL